MGRLDAERVMREMSARQLALWERFAAEEPFGSAVDDVRFGHLAAVVVNANPFRGEGAKPVSPEQMKPKWERPRRRSVQQRPTSLRQIAMIGGVKVERL